jgi:hypothetical protein
MDPFAEGQATPDDPAKQDAVRASEDLWVDLPAPEDPAPFGSPDPASVPDPPAPKPAPEIAGGEFPDLGPLIADLVVGKDPQHAYESLVA